MSLDSRLCAIEEFTSIGGSSALLLLCVLNHLGHSLDNAAGPRFRSLVISALAADGNRVKTHTSSLAGNEPRETKLR